MKRIFVVEDNDGIRELLGSVLESSGFKVTLAQNGKKALEILTQFDPPDLILTDLRMPEMTGLELIGNLRIHKAYSKIPVLVISSEPDLDQVEGVHGYLNKPFPLEALLSKVNEVLNLSRRSRSA